MPAIGNAQSFRSPPPKPALKPPAAKPASTAPAYQAFHTSEAASQQPAVQRANQQITSRAIAGQPYQAFHSSEAASQQPSVQRANAQLAARAVPATDAAIINVFKVQPPALQRAVVQNAVKYPTLPASKIILNFVRQQTSGPQGALSPITAAIKAPELGAVSRALAGPEGTFGKILKNAASDAWNLAPATVEGTFGLAKNVVTGHEGTALHMLVDPYVQFAEHPIKTLEQHPLNTALLLAGPKAVIGRGAGFAMRTGALGDTAKAAASTVRAPLHVGTIAGEPSPILEARSYSPDVLNKALQVARERVQRARGRNPNVSTPSRLPEATAYALNRGTQAKLLRGTDEMTATHQATHRTERNIAVQTLQRARPAKAARDVVSFVSQRIIRKPETAVEDTVKEINRLKAAQADLPRRSLELHQNRQQVRALSTALKTPGALEEAFRADQQIAPFINSQDAALHAHGFLDPEQAMRSKVFPYAQAHMGAKYDPIGQRLVGPDGKELSTQVVLDHLKESGVSDPAFVAHELNKVGAGRFYKSYQLARGTLNRNRVRTGKAFTQGAYDHSWNGLIGQVADRAQTLARGSLHDRVITRYGVRIPQAVQDRLGISKPANADFTPEEAARVARAAVVDDHGNPIPNALELTPVQRSAVSQLDHVRNLQSPRELANVSQIELKALADSIEQTARRTDSNRNVVLVPTEVVNRFAQQYAKTDGLLRSVGRVTQQFRRTVLPYSTHWMLQIGSEAGLRAVLAGVLHPDYLRTGRQLTHDLSASPEGRAVNAELTQSTLYNGGGSSVREAAAGHAGRGQLDVHNPNAGRLAALAKSLPPSRVLIAAHNRYADTVTAAMYGLEHNARLLGLGKLAHKEIQSFGHSWSNAVRMEGRLIAGLADRLKAEPELVARFGREVDNMFGKYAKFTPKQRAMIQSITPFLPWYLNAAKYVFWYLPAHHPVASSLMASLRQTINQDVQDGKQAPLNVWAMQELARISPFGIFTPPSTRPSTGAALAGQQLTGAVLPQIESAFYNLAGINAFGDAALKGPKGDVKAKSGPALAAAAEGGGEAFLPALRYLRLALAGGRPTYGTSTVVSPEPKAGEKPGTPASIVNRIFNPFYSVQSAQSSSTAPAYGAAAGASSGGKSGWGGGTSSSASGWGGGTTSASGWGG